MRSTSCWGSLPPSRRSPRTSSPPWSRSPGTLEYRYALNADATSCHIYERYRDSAALLAHAEMFGRTYSERFMAACTPSRFSIYGTPSEEAKAILAQYGGQFFADVIQPIVSATSL